MAPTDGGASGDASDTARLLDGARSRDRAALDLTLLVRRVPGGVLEVR